MPELRRVRPEKNLKLGPALSSSHCRQSFRLPSGLLFGSPVTQLRMQRSQHSCLVCRMLNSQMVMQGIENPSRTKQFLMRVAEMKPRAPQVLTGSVRFCLM